MDATMSLTWANTMAGSAGAAMSAAIDRSSRGCSQRKGSREAMERHPEEPNPHILND
jgi:hypothetical protein